MISEILHRDIRNEVPVSIDILEKPIHVGGDSDYSELVALGESVHPGISLEPVLVDVASIEYSTQEVDEKGRFAGTGRQISGFLMNHMVYTQHVKEDHEDFEGALAETRAEALYAVIDGIHRMNESKSVQEAVKTVSGKETTSKTNVWFGLAK